MAATAPATVPPPLDNLECHVARLRSAIQQAQRELHGLQHAVAETAALTQGWSTAEPADSQPSALSREELGVAQVLTRGRSSQEIASTLHVSVHTVKSQVRSILRKRGLRSRWQVVREPPREG